MAEIRKVCLDCGKVETQPCAPGEEARTVHGLCDECYKRLKERDPELAEWAFKGGEEEKK